MARGRAEVDVLATTQPRGLRFIECKGYRPGGILPDDMVRAWLQVRVPLVRKAALAHPDWKSRKMTFELWTTGSLSSAASDLIGAAQDTVSSTKYTIIVRDADKLEELAKESQDAALLRTLAEHFLEHPLQTIERDLERMSARERHRAMARGPAVDDQELLDVFDDVVELGAPKAALPTLGKRGSTPRRQDR